MTSFRLGPLTLASVWQPPLHPLVRALEFPPMPGIDCDDCRMVRLGFFSERTKCCTFVPELPNFLVGEILSHGDVGAATVQSFVEQGRGDPLYLYAPPLLRQRHRTAALTDPRQAMPCPLLDAAGRCTVYEHRPYLCASYHCAYPEAPEYRGMWNGLSSLLALHSAILAQHLVEALGLDRGRLIDTWETVRDETAVWSAAGGIEASFAQALWQGQGDAAAFYRACFDYVSSHAHTIRADLDAFRRAQLLRLLTARGLLTENRRREIESQASEPVPMAPPLPLQTALAHGVVVFGDHLWTVPEHEGFVLWFHAQLKEAGVF